MEKKYIFCIIYLSLKQGFENNCQVAFEVDHWLLAKTVHQNYVLHSPLYRGFQDPNEMSELSLYTSFLFNIGCLLRSCSFQIQIYAKGCPSNKIIREIFPITMWQACGSTEMEKSCTNSFHFSIFIKILILADILFFKYIGKVLL